MKIQALLFICCTTILVSAVEVKAQKDKDAPTQVVHIKKLDKRVSELMADRVGIRKNMELKELATFDEKAMEERESLMFPAEELYGSNWENQWVDPFRGTAKVNFPDSFAIDCSSFVYPIAMDSMARITSKYGPRRRRMHRGIDLKVLVGDTIRAAFDGKVRIKNFERRGYGNYVVIRHPNGLETVYGHLSKILVTPNDIVHAGDPIALGGNTGRSTGSHLHFETRFLGQAINPADIIDFENSVPHQDTYVFHNIKINGRKSNIYTSSSDQMVYHRVKSGVFHDDAVLTDFEDVSPEAVAAWRQTGLGHDAGPVPQRPQERQAWMRFKSQTLTRFTLDLRQAVQAIRGPQVKTARNLFALPILEPQSEAWFAQNLDDFLAAYDWTVPMAMPLMESVPIDASQAWLTRLVQAVARHPGALKKTIFELQARDWNRCQQNAIPDQQLADWMRLLRLNGVKNYGYYPDDFINNQPDISRIRPQFSSWWYPDHD